MLNSDLVCAYLFVGFEGPFVAGENNDLSLLAKLLQYFNESFITFVIEVDEHIIQNSGQGFGTTFIFINQTKTHGEIKLLQRPSAHFLNAFSFMLSVLNENIIAVNGFDDMAVCSVCNL